MNAAEEQIGLIMEIRRLMSNNETAKAQLLLSKLKKMKPRTNLGVVK